MTEHAGPSAATLTADELVSLRPRELLLPPDMELTATIPGVDAAGVRITHAEPGTFELGHAERALIEQLGTASLDGFGLDPDEHGAAVRAAGALVQYLRDTQKADLAHLKTLEFRTRADHLLMDAGTLRHLEILEGVDGGRSGSLLAEIDATATPMGGRLLRAWLQRPLARARPDTRSTGRRRGPLPSGDDPGEDPDPPG